MRIVWWALLEAARQLIVQLGGDSYVRAPFLTKFLSCPACLFPRHRDAALTWALMHRKIDLGELIPVFNGEPDA